LLQNDISLWGDRFLKALMGPKKSRAGRDGGGKSGHIVRPDPH